MNERTLQFRVGLFVILALIAAAMMVFQFGELHEYWEPRYALAIHFPSAPGVYRSTPVEQNGLKIGAVSDVVFDGKRGGVIVVVEIAKRYRLRTDTQVRLRRSLLGDATIDFIPGRAKTFLENGARLEGEPASDPLHIVARLDEKMGATLDSFRATSEEWRAVGRHLNSLVETNEGDIDAIVEETAKALKQFSSALQGIEAMVANAENQENIRRTLESLPKLVEETHQTVATIRSAAAKAEETMAAVNGVAAPLAERGPSIAMRLDETLGSLQSLSRELDAFVKMATREDGSLNKFVADPALYQNLNQSAMSLAVVLKNLEPIMRDLRIFSDKVARHPELMGVGGALRGSSGLKEPIEPISAEQSAGRIRVRDRR